MYSLSLYIFHIGMNSFQVFLEFSRLLEIRGLLCEFIAGGIISLAFLIKKLLTFMMIWEITLE